MSEKTKTHPLLLLTIGLLAGALLMFLIQRLQPEEQGFVYKANEVNKKRFKEIKGGEATRDETKKYATEYFKFITKADPARTKTDVAYYTAQEFLDYLQVIHDSLPDILDTDIRIYVNPMLYTANTLNRYENDRNVGNRFTNALIFCHKQNSVNWGEEELELGTQYGVLGIYNWGSLEP